VPISTAYLRFAWVRSSTLYQIYLRVCGWVDGTDMMCVTTTLPDLTPTSLACQCVYFMCLSRVLYRRVGKSRVSWMDGWMAWMRQKKESSLT